MVKRLTRKSWPVALAAILLAAPAPGQGRLPNIVVLATGGTIAGAASSDVQAAYTSGQVGVEQLIAAVPQAKKLATLRGEQISNIGSQDMNDEVWLKLGHRVNELAAMPDVDGIVITHGTDTIEETAYFLNLIAKTKKPVVLTAAMRPSTALSADGPLNFYNAVAVTANQGASGRRHHDGLLRLSDEIQKVGCFFDRVRAVRDDDSIYIRHGGQFINAVPKL